MESKYKFLLCRLCLGRSECLSDIFEDNGSRGYTAADIISDLLQLKVSKMDAYPQLVCLECLDKLIDFKTFKACCIGAKTIFEDKFSIHASTFKVKHTSKTSIEENVATSDDQGSHIISDESIDIEKDRNTFEEHSTVFCDTVMKADTEDFGSENDAAQQKDDVMEGNNITSCPVEIKEEELYLSNTDNENSSTAIDQAKGEEVCAEKLSISCGMSDQLSQQKQEFISRLMENEAKRCTTNNLVQKKDDNYVCETCGHSFITHRSYLEHTYRHTGEKPYKCTFCGNHFRQLQTLRKHTQRIHFEKPYSCKFCTRKFMKEKTLLSHVKIHNREKTFPCKLCKKKFCYVKSLERHILKHSAHKISFDCNECGKKFLTRYALKGHLTLHTGEKAYMCDECGKSIRLYSNFVVHKRVHSGEKPYCCDLCKKRFTQKGSLNSHMKLHKNV